MPYNLIESEEHAVFIFNANFCPEYLSTVVTNAAEGHNIVAYRPIAKGWLCKERPFLGSGSVNPFPLPGNRFIIVQQLDYNNGNGVFLRGPCRVVISKGQS
jgi:hypothetical protein